MPEIKPTPSLRFTTHPKPRPRTTRIVCHHTAGNAAQEEGKQPAAPANRKNGHKKETAEAD